MSRPLEPPHAKLAKRAAQWLRRNHEIVITEISGGSETPDAIGFRGNSTTLIECKASRSDFLADKRKFFRKQPGSGMGDYRYYFTPKGMIALAELPPGWGLLEQRGRSIYEVMDASCFNEHNTCGERAILISLIRRIGQDSPKGVSVNFYTFQTKNTATAGVEEKETNNRIYDLTIEALQADGAHHKQWYLEEILKAVGRSDVFEKSSGVIWDKGVAP